MMHRADVGIVEIARMSKCAIDECRARRVEAIAEKQNAAGAVAAQVEREPSCRSTPRQACTDGNDAKEVEHKRLHSVDDHLRCIFEAEIRGPLGQNACRSASGHAASINGVTRNYA